MGPGSPGHDAVSVPDDPPEPWPGQWVADALDLALEGEPDPGTAGVTDLVGLALRRNPRRAHLLVSRVIGKHFPCDPRLVRAAGLVLGHRVAALLRGISGRAAPTLPADAVTDPRVAARARDAAVEHPTRRVPSVVLGYAENATGLGWSVAEVLDSHHLVTSTRRVVPGAASLGSFEEQHSHAARHLVLPDDPGRWSPELPLVLVDDELTTGRTVAGTLRLLHGTVPRARYVVATLVDVRGPGDDALERTAADLGVRVDVVALARGTLRVPDDAGERAAAMLARLPPARPSAWGRGTLATVHLDLGGAPENARHGLDRSDRAAFEAALPAAVARLTAALGPDPGRLLVLGTEELVHLPVRLAEGLADAGHDVSVAATTRSPAAALDAPGCALRSALPFPAHDAGLGTTRERFAYNVGPTGRHGTIVLVVDADARGPALHRPGGLVPGLRALAPRVIEVVVPCRRPRPGRAVTARRGPSFGTFAPDEVAWLLEDLSTRALEVGLERRERDVREGRAHYSEALPEELLPSPAYEEHFHRALARSATTVARLVGRLTDRLLSTEGPRPVLVSLARAGTPVGVLMRRWAGRVRGVDLPHYAMSVVRGRGIDGNALAALTAAHDPASLVFVDGWTGKGGIVDELTAGLAAQGLPATVVALSDPAHVATLAGTREDLLVPSACLTATVCGLVSRTVRRPDLVGAAGYDGAKFYPMLSDGDRTATFLDGVSTCFEAVAEPGVEPDRTEEGPADRRGPAYVAALADELGVDDRHRIKPGLGETTRMLLRRLPEAVLLAPDAGPDADHLRALCRTRGVPVRELPELAGTPACPYRSVGIVRGRAG